MLLANYVDVSQNPSTKWMHSIQKKYKRELMYHRAPSHFNRQWLSYVAVAGAGIATAIYFRLYSQAHTLFILDPHARSISSTLHDSPPVLGYDYVNHKGQ